VISAQRRLRLRLARRPKPRGAARTLTAAVLIRSPCRACDAAQDEDRRDAEDREHEQRGGGAERQVAGADAEQEGVGREHMGHVARAAPRS